MESSYAGTNIDEIMLDAFFHEIKNLTEKTSLCPAK